MNHRLIPFALALCAALLADAPAQAQYKVVGPDGKVTYTDRAPVAAGARITALGASSAAVFEVALPLELRQVSTRYPVTLYVTGGECEPCAAARQLLRQRGVPHTEKQIIGAEDSDALERLSGGRDAPTVTIGSQTLRGLAPEVWSSYLDAAGYPRESRLPANYQFAAPTPLTERREALARATPAQRAASAEAAVSTSRPVPAAPGGIRF